MYRTPIRRDFSPEHYRNSPSPPPPQRGRSLRSSSWGRSSPNPHRSRSRGRSSPNPHRSRSRGRSSPKPHRSRSRGRSPCKPRRSRSPSKPRRSRSRGRSPGSRRSRSRPATILRSRSRSRSRSRPRRYPEEDCQYEKRYSPDYRLRDSRSPDRHSDRSGSGKDGGHDVSSSTYRGGSWPRPLDEPLPMPKKSILKKRIEVDPGNKPFQVDAYSGGRDLGPVKPLLGDRSSLVPPGEMTGKSVAAGLPVTSGRRKSDSPLLMGISPLPIIKPVAAEKISLNSGSRTLQHNPGTSSVASAGQNRPSIPFTKEKEKHAAESRGGFAFLHKVKAETTLPKFPVVLLQEIEDEERFLYGDEVEDKPPEVMIKPPNLTLPAQAPNSAPNMQEYTKIHDLLKTIGLDIGVAEIGKLAERTQERLHGKKPMPKSPQVMPKAAHAPPERPPNAPSISLIESIVGTRPEPAVKAESKEREALARSPVNEQKPPVASQPPAKERAPPAMQNLLLRELPVSKAEVQNAPQPISTVPTVSAVQAISTVPTLSTVQAISTVPTLSTVQAISTVPTVSAVQTISTVPTLSSVQPPPITPVPELTPPINPPQISMYHTYTPTGMVPNYTVPPPSFNPYTSYVSYPSANWPIYTPPPVHPPPPVHVNTPVHVSTPTITHNPRGNLLVIEPNADLTEVKTSMKPEAKTYAAAALLVKHEAERRNKEIEKQKVLDDLEGLRKKVKANTENLKTLSAKVEQLRVQQGILLRKKRREKDGHKDPLLEELSSVLDSAQKQILSLAKEISDTKQKEQQLIKVAEILGVDPADLVEKTEPCKIREKSPESPVSSWDANSEVKHRGSSKEKSDSKCSKDDSSPKLSEMWDNQAGSSSKADVDSKGKETLLSGRSPRLSADSVEQEDDKKVSSTELNSDIEESSKPSSLTSSKPEDVPKSRDKSRSKSPRTSTPSSNVSPKVKEPISLDLPNMFAYYDAGGHWCEDCNFVCQTVSSLLLHLHEKKHSESLRYPRKPWLKKTEPELPEAGTGKPKLSVPLKGLEFMVPTVGYYCSLCEQAFPDHSEAGEHVRSYLHNEKFKKYTDANTSYEFLRRRQQKAMLMAEEESFRRAEQKRKLEEKRNEASKSKKAKREQDEERNSRHRSRTSASPVKSERKKRTPTPDKEQTKIPTFQFNWKTPENKNQASAIVPKAEAAVGKENEEVAKGSSVKAKSIEIKLMGKPSHAQGSPPTSSNSSVTSTSTTSLPTSTFPITSTVKVRPNLPVSITVQRKASSAMNKPSPLNTFLSIKSSDATSKSLPVVKGKPSPLLSEEVVSKAFAGETVLKETPSKMEPIFPATAAAAKTSSPVSPNLEKPPQPNSETKKTHDLYDMLFNKKGSSSNTKTEQKKTTPIPLIVSGVKSSAPSSSRSQGAKNDSSRSAKNIQQEQKSKDTTQQPSVTASPRTVEAQSKVTTAAVPKLASGSSPKSTFQKDPSVSSNKLPLKPGLLPQEKGKEAGADKPVATKATVKPEQATASMAKGSHSSINKLTGRLENLPVQDSKPKKPDNQKPLETKNATVTQIQSASQPKDSLTTVPNIPLKPTYNPTATLNQKFKREPLSLPTSLFGHVPDTGCKDIKITTMAPPKESPDKAKPIESQMLLAQNQVSMSFTDKTCSSKPQLQQELETYYSLIATEDDPEDLVPCEDQEVDSPDTITRITVPPKMDIPEKRMKLESPSLALKVPVALLAPDLSGEEVDDSDMACEVPEVPISISGLSMVQSSYSLSPTYGSSSKEPARFPRGQILVNRDYRKKEQKSTVATQYSKAELDILTTCDSD